MELHYKTYQKIKIYLDKIHCAHGNLKAMLNRTAFSDCETLIMIRLTELYLMEAQLVEFCMNPKHSLPYVPPSRCKGFTSWYGSEILFAPNSSSGFRKKLREADVEVLREAEYTISDENVPLVLKEMFKKHRVRFKKIQETESVLDKEGQA